MAKQFGEIGRPAPEAVADIALGAAREQLARAAEQAVDRARMQCADAAFVLRVEIGGEIQQQRNQVCELRRIAR